MNNNFSNLYDDLFGNGAAKANAGRKINERRINNLVDSVNKSTDALIKKNQADIHDLCEDVKKNAGKTANTEAEPKKITATAESFAGLEKEIEGKVFGQDEFIRKLIISFKRPFVMEPAEKMPKNSVFITGKPYTGRHFALGLVMQACAKKGILVSDKMSVIDLSLYPTAAEEKLFLQDIYSALSEDTSVIAFEHIEDCHPSFIGNIVSLVREGSFSLSERYVMQKGNLVGVTNALAAGTVGALSAEGKYLLFISEKKIGKLADICGAPFVSALGDVCEAADLTEENYKDIAKTELEKLTKASLEKLKLKITASDDVVNLAAGKADKNTNAKGILDFFERLFRGLAGLRLETDIADGTELVLKVENGDVKVLNGEEEIDVKKYMPASYMGEIDAVKAELDSIVGLKEIKEYILGLEEYYKTQQKRKEAGLKTAELSKHMIFTGNPGTGKTTIARIVSRYLKAIGVLTGGQLIEVSRADLVGRYVGHTAPLVNQVISSAIGGVLFIDEAYSLYRGQDDSFGLEAIDTLVKGIEDNRDNLIVILAGYSNEMKEFLTANSGLESRFPNIIEFPDYSGEELLEIAKINAASRGYNIDEGALLPLKTYFNTVQATSPAKAGNGRLARNVIEEAILNQSKRLVAEEGADLSMLLSNDFDLT